MITRTPFHYTSSTLKVYNQGLYRCRKTLLPYLTQLLEADIIPYLEGSLPLYSTPISIAKSNRQYSRSPCFSTPPFENKNHIVFEWNLQLTILQLVNHRVCTNSTRLLWFPYEIGIETGGTQPMISLSLCCPTPRQSSLNSTSGANVVRRISQSFATKQNQEIVQDLELSVEDIISPR